LSLGALWCSPGALPVIREVLFREEMAYGESAAVGGISESNIGVRLNRARQKTQRASRGPSMSKDAELECCRRQWQRGAEPAGADAVAQLQRRVLRETRWLKWSLIAPILVTLSVGGS
jgi:hypothetical protein